MRKTTPNHHFLIFILACVGFGCLRQSYAATTEVVFDSKKTYSIKNVGRNIYLGFQTSSYTETNVTNATPFCDTPCEFVIKRSGNSFVIRYAGPATDSSEAFGHYLSIGAKTWNTGITSDPSAIWTFEETGTADHYYIKSTQGYLKTDGAHSYAYTDGNSKDNNSTWIITEVGTAPVFPDAVLPPIAPDATEREYFIKNVSSATYLTLQTTYEETAVVNATPLSATPAPFTFDKSNSKYGIKSGSAYVGLSTTSRFDGWNTKNYSTPQYIWEFEETSSPGTYYIHSTKGYLKYDGTNSFAYTDGTAKNAKASWTITPYFETVSTFSDGKYYRLRNYLDETRFITSDNGAIFAYPATEDIFDQIWQATKEGDNWKLMCVLDGQSIRDSRKDKAYATGTNGSALVVTAKGTATDGRPYVMIAPANSPTGFLNNSKSNQQFQVVPWSDANDNSSWWYIEQTTISPADVERINQLREESSIASDILENANSYAGTLTTFFADKACTRLKPEYATLSDEALGAAIGSTLPEALKTMAVSVKDNRWDADATRSSYVKRFRIAEYEVYSDPGKWRAITNVGPFGVLTNPTGITVSKNDLLYIMVGAVPADANATLRLAIARDTEQAPAQTVDLFPGLNIVQSTVKGECFILYTLTDTERQLADYAPITVHIEGGEATGCWDANRGMTNADWTWLSENMFTAPFLHVKGRSTVLNLVTDKVRGAENPEGIMKIWDFIFDTEERLIGNDGQWNGRYRPVINPRDAHADINPNWGGNYGTNHPNIDRNYLFNFEKMVNDVGHLWEIYHEEAHAHQYPINLAATTESSNNGYAQMVNYEFGSYNSRNKGIETLLTFKNNGWGWVDILRAGEGTSRSEGFQYYDDALWLQCHLFYQLYLYFHVQGHMPDFWPRVADRMRQLTLAGDGIKYGRSAEAPGYYYNDYLLFAKVCAEVSQTDLYEFFDTWGFFSYCDEVKVGNDYVKENAQWFKNNDRPDLGVRYVGDYGSYYLRMPIRNNAEDEAYLAALKAEMQAMPKKAPGIMFIDDHNRILNVSDTCFIARSDIYPSRVGTPMGNYNNGKLSGDFGLFTDFRPDNSGSGINFAQNGTSYTNVGIDGTGIVGVKIYDETGRIVRIYNTKSFTLDATTASKVKSGDYKFLVCLGDDSQMLLNSKDFDMNLDGSYTIADISLLVKALSITTDVYTTGNVDTLRDKVLE